MIHSLATTLLLNSSCYQNDSLYTLLLFVFITFLSFSSFAQRPLEVEISTGSAYFKGDISSNIKGLSTVGFGLRFNLNPSFAIPVYYNHLRFEGNQGGSFKTNVKEYNVLLEWYPLKRIKIENKNFAKRNYLYDRTFQPYINFGAGLAVARFESTNALMNAACSPFSCFRIHPYIPIHLGAGFRLFLNHKLALNLNTSWRFPNTDALDNIFNGKEDYYTNAQIGMLYAIGYRGYL